MFQKYKQFFFSKVEHFPDKLIHIHVCLKFNWKPTFWWCVGKATNSPPPQKKSNFAFLFEKGMWSCRQQTAASHTLRQCHLKTITFQCIYGSGMLRQSITGLFKQFWSEGKIACQGGVWGLKHLLNYLGMLSFDFVISSMNHVFIFINTCKVTFFFFFFFPIVWTKLLKYTLNRAIMCHVYKVIEVNDSVYHY